MTVEGKIQKKAIDYARGLGFLAKRQYNGPGVETGWPDVMFYGFKSLHFLIEFKPDPDEEPSKIQQHRISELVERGHRVYVCGSLEQAKAVIDLEYERLATIIQQRPRRARRR